jgi:hypothetical protein
MPIAKLGLEGNIPSLFCGDGTNCWTLVDPSQNLVYVPLLTTELKTWALFWTIFNFPFVFDVVVITFLTIMLLVKDQ